MEFHENIRHARGRKERGRKREKKRENAFISIDDEWSLQRALSAFYCVASCRGDSWRKKEYEISKSTSRRQRFYRTIGEGIFVPVLSRSVIRRSDAYLYKTRRDFATRTFRYRHSRRFDAIWKLSSDKIPDKARTLTYYVPCFHEIRYISRLPPPENSHRR